MQNRDTERRFTKCVQFTGNINFHISVIWSVDIYVGNEKLKFDEMMIVIGLQVIAVYGGKFACTLSLIGLYPFNIYINCHS